MIISYFEEFPSKSNLDKLKFVTYKTKLYIAAKSLLEFNLVVGRIKREYIHSAKFIVEYVYWPIIERKEGYWISPFTKRDALLRIFSELDCDKIGKKINVMLDFELPTTKNPLLYITQCLNFFKNKKLIKDFIINHKGNVYAAEYHVFGKYKEKLLQIFGLHYDLKKLKVIKMLYHSMMPVTDNFYKKELKKVKDSGCLAGLGTIAEGIFGIEPILSPEKLEFDLTSAKYVGVEEVIIFRLGGMNNRYNKIVKKFI
ncbi:hypothetical protein HN385_02090 [archaeon]|jgi:hypothetical protein|nr:hypothetical protein [archaeon]MBT3450344.1 hypothetical protein [archaeon]MBT6868881.1 hypothetical protein [archaeon]MBT7192898.1 hypothetical protein [archaeon]MBT7380864.1 hypothetical protein [archaeon]